MEKSRCLAVLAAACAAAACATTPEGPPVDLDGLEVQVDSLERWVTELEQRMGAIGPEVAGSHGGFDGPFAGNFYESTGVVIPPLREKLRYALLLQLFPDLAASEIHTLDYRGPHGAKRYRAPWQDANGFEEVPTQVLFAIANVAKPELRGAEWDMISPMKKEPDWHVSVRHDRDGRLTAIAAQRTLPPVSAGTVSREAIRQRYGIGPVENAGRSWSADALATLDGALARLSPRELEGIRGVAFRRVRKVSKQVVTPAGTEPAGLYNVEKDQHWIEIADRAFEEDERLFVGEPGAPASPSARTILHEIGHALALRDAYEISALATRIHNGFNKARLDSKRLRRSISGSDVLTFNRAQLTLSGVSDRARPLIQSIGGVASRSHVLAAYAELPGVGEGPTRYGRTDVGESFAEAFSLYRLDPSALRRISPETLQFFEAERHLRPAGDMEATR